MVEPARSRSVRRVVAALAALFVVIVAVWWVLPDRVRYWSEIRRVEALAPKLEEYRAVHGRYPSRQELPVEPPTVYMPDKDGKSYQIGFSVEWDINEYYDARTKHWSFDDPKR